MLSPSLCASLQRAEQFNMDQLGEPSFHFVAFREPRVKGKKTSEKELSQARSHAARISHKQRRWARQENSRRDLVWVNEGTHAKSAADASNLPPTRARIPPSPWSILPQDKTDPFGSHQMERLPKYLTDCMEYGWSTE